MMFIPGRVYKRRDLHAKCGGQRQGGISTPQGHPVVLLFTGESGHKYGYSDGPQEDGTFWYTGEGQVGDMQMVKGNLAIRDHQARGKSLHLFEQVQRGMVRYVGEATYVGHHFAPAPDRDGRPRQAIVFDLSLESNLAGTGHSQLLEKQAREAPGLRAKSLDELRELALAKDPTDAPPKHRRGQTSHPRH